jgi:RecJ-like exonuclease
MQIPQKMHEQYLEAKQIIENSEDIKVYSHIDCDGICSGAILSTILDRQNKEHEIEFVNLDVLDNMELEHELTIFSDLGSGQHIDTKAKKGQKIIILDHHPPLRDLDYRNDKDYTYLEINPIHHGIDGSYYVCGGGLCYFLAKEFGYTDLSWIGVLSAIGDMQNTRTGHFEGLNEIIQQDAIDGGYLALVKNDINIYGRNTRPLFVALSYFSDVKLPITNNTAETMAILEELEIDEKHNRKTLNQLTMAEKGRLYKRLNEMLSKAVPGKYVKYIPRLILGDSYTFLKEDETSFLRDGSEFSTAMNACGRNHE